MSNIQYRIAFVSVSPWGGAEHLWSETALHLKRNGQTVAASVWSWPKEATQLLSLQGQGVNVHSPLIVPDWIRNEALQKIAAYVIRRCSLLAFKRWLARTQPDIICISNGSNADDLRLIDLCARSGSPYVLLVQANSEVMWPKDVEAAKLIDLFRRARRVCFVADANRVLLETQLGIELTNAEVVRNPFNVQRDAAPPWPSDSDVVRLACVGRLDPRSKGQDLLLRVVAREPWRSRPLLVSFFGRGVMEQGLRRLARRLGLDQRVEFCGHVDDIERMWATHHALILPSRHEGLPLVIVEAMLCGRPVIVTDVGGNAEIVQDGITGFIAEAATEHHLDMAMQRAWRMRREWAAIGQAAALAIRKLMPIDATATFARRLLELADTRRTPLQDPQDTSVTKSLALDGLNR